MLGGAVEASECPLALERLLVALDLPVCLRPPRLDEAVLDRVRLQELPE
jgi:hypothetical protein